LYFLFAVSLLINAGSFVVAGYWVHLHGGLRHMSVRSNNEFARRSYDLRREFFHDFDVKPRTRRPIVMFGDSLTSNGLWTEWFGSRVLNRGIGGETSAEAFHRITDVTSLTPEKVFILTGTNDYGVLPATQTVSNIVQIVMAVRSASPKTEIYLQSLLPPPTLTRQSWTNEINEALKELAATQNLHWVDLQPAFADGPIVRREFTVDGVHPSPAGYEAWCEVLRPYLSDSEAISASTPAAITARE
jgi:lysophospholipase L1-like esterase